MEVFRLAKHKTHSTHSERTTNRPISIMKKKAIRIAIALSLALAFPAAGAAIGRSAATGETGALPKNATVILSDRTVAGETLQSRIDRAAGGDYAAIERLILQSGCLTADDCRFIKQHLTSLEEIVVEEDADFSGGTIPKGAFEGHRSLKRFRADRATQVGAKAFSLCDGLEEVDLPNVRQVGVQAFAQAKGSSTSKLRTVRLPRLEQLEPRSFYYCTHLEALYLTAPPTPRRPEGKEGLWFERVTRLVIHVPDRKAYEAFVDVKNCGNIDWSAFYFTADNGDELPRIERAAEYDDRAYDHLRDSLLPVFDRTDKDFSGEYYTGDFKLSLNLYTFNMNLNAWLNGSSSVPQLSTLDAIRWAAGAGFDAVDVTCYYIPGYSNTEMPTRPEAEVLDFARRIRTLCAELGIAVSGTGLQNNFADPNEQRRKTDVERIKFWIKVAAEMGAPVIRIFAGPPPADIRREGWEKIVRERMVPHIRQVARWAKEHYPDVRIGLQNHGGMLATANQVIQTLRWIDCDNVGIINDTGFYRDFLSTDATHYDWYRDIALVLPYSNNFQIKKKPAGAETREAMDLVRLIRDIRKSPYRGYLPVELLWVSKDEGYPGNLDTPPYNETLRFVDRLKQAIEQTEIPPTRAPQPAASGSGRVLRMSDGRMELLDNTCPAQLTEALGSGTSCRVTAADGSPRSELEPIADGDRVNILSEGCERDYTVAIKRYELTNLALNPAPERIKKSSFRGKSTSVLRAFDGNSTGTSGTGYQVDASQANTSGKQTFWLALDLGEQKRIDAFGVAWGTSVGQLKKRLHDGTYRVAYTCEETLWQALSDAKQSGKAGLDGYAVPQGWTEAYAQSVYSLPDANGNKVFIKTLAQPVTARYVLVTGDLAGGSIEIYNFFVFQKQLLDGAKPRPVYPASDLARIKPDYEGMVLAPGRPALVRLGTRVPAFHLSAQQPLTFTAKLIAPDGSVAYTSAPATLVKGQTCVLTPDAAATQEGTYRMQFIFAGDPPLYDACYFTAIDERTDRYTFSNPYPPLRLVNDRFVYTPDWRGNTVIDYSHAGYRGGGVAIPGVPTRIILEPSADPDADDTERIEQAVDLIGRIPIGSDGFRGALLLKAGTFRISRPIRIARSGVVVRGEGDGREAVREHPVRLGPDNWIDYTQSEAPEANVTKVVATWVADSYDKNKALFEIGGSRAIAEEAPVAITDQYVPAGTHTLHLAQVGGFRAGDNVRIRRAVNAAWTQDLRTDAITDAPGVLSANQWAINGRVEKAFTGICQERTVASVDPKSGTLTLTEPIVDPLDRKYGISTVARFSTADRVRNAGVENLQLIARFDKKSTAVTTAFDVDYKYYDDECHAQVGVRIFDAEDVWVRRLTEYHLDVAVNVSSGARRVTVQDVNCLEPVSGTGGERRYSFTNSGGTQVLNQRCYVRYTRHGFIVMGHVMGPNVFLHDRSDFQFDANEPHLRWSAGGLFDNVEGRIYVQNRWNNGTAHGWAGANYTLWNCTGKFIVSQNPLAANYLFGQADAADRLPYVMDEVDPGNVPNFRATEYSVGRKMNPASLYLRQLEERLGPDAVAAAEDASIPPCRDESEGLRERFAQLKEITVDGAPLPGFDPQTLDYTVPVALDYDALPQIAARGEKGTTVKRSADGQRVSFAVSKPGGFESVYTVRYGIVSKEPVSGDGSAEELRNLTDRDPQTQWSHPGTPRIQFYLGESPVGIEAVSMGYCRNTQSRRQYYFEFEVSDDGYHWTPVRSDAWQPDNLGRGHVMGMQLQPGVGNNPSDYETFLFPRGTRARLLRISMYGARFGRGSGTANANAYWAIDVRTRQDE